VTEAGSSVVAIRELAEKKYDRSGGGGEALFERLSANKQKVLTAFVLHGSSITNIDQFINAASFDPVQVGFKADVLRASSSQWVALYQFLTGLRGMKGAR
jgi:fructose/tagatose bisphosphate aldolase